MRECVVPSSTNPYLPYQEQCANRILEGRVGLTTWVLADRRFTDCAVIRICRGLFDEIRLVQGACDDCLDLHVHARYYFEHSLPHELGNFVLSELELVILGDLNHDLVVNEIYDPVSGPPDPPHPKDGPV